MATVKPQFGCLEYTQLAEPDPLQGGRHSTPFPSGTPTDGVTLGALGNMQSPSQVITKAKEKASSCFPAVS